MIIGIFHLLVNRVHDMEQLSQIVLQLCMGSITTPIYSKVASRYNLRLPLSRVTIGTWMDNRIGSLWGERESHLCHLYSISSIICEWANTDMCPYDGMHHQQKTFLSGQNGSVRVDALRPSRQRHPGGGLHRARRQNHASGHISPSDRHFTVSSRSVGLLF